MHAPARYRERTHTADIHTHRHTERQADRQADRQTDGQIELSEIVLNLKETIEGGNVGVSFILTRQANKSEAHAGGMQGME